MKPVICITEKEYQKAADIFQSSPAFNCISVKLDENILSKTAKENNAVGVILGVDVYKDQLYQSLSKGGIIARFGVGILLFVISGVGNVDIKKVLKNIWPFYLVLIAVILLVAFIPDISLWLVNILNVKA